MITGITVKLHERTVTGEDELGNPVYGDKVSMVSDVLVSPTTADDVPTANDMSRSKAVYTLAIPKGDNHTWDDNIVEFYGTRWRVVGVPLEGIVANIPLRWNKKVTVERYE